MRMEQCVSASLADPLRADAETMHAVSEFMRFIPENVLHADVDTTKSSKVGLVDGDKVYKFGLILERRQVFIEYFEHREEKQPTMEMIVDRPNASVQINGFKDGQAFTLSYRFHDGHVEKAAQFG